MYFYTITLINVEPFLNIMKHDTYLDTKNIFVAKKKVQCQNTESVINFFNIQR